MTSWSETSDRVCDAAVGAVALWTLCAHAAVFTGLGLDALIALAGVSGVGIVAARLRWRGGGEPEPTAPGSPVPGDRAPADWQRAAVAVWAAGCVGAVGLDAPLGLVWPAAAALVLTLAARELLAPPRQLTPSLITPRPKEVGSPWILALALLCVVVTLASHRPDADDGFYLNLAVAAAEDPDAPLLANDTLHRIPDVPLPLPVYRVHSLELLQGAISRLTGAQVLDVAHLLLPALAALLVPFAFARLHRRILPRAWPWATGASIAVLLFTATASHGWANFGLVRLHQGKALLLTLLLPLAIACAIEYAQRGGTRSWVRLAAVQIAAVGVSASGLWLAPAVAGLGLWVGIGSLRRPAAWTRLGVGLCASAYPLVLAAALRGATAAAFENAAVPSPELELSSLDLASQSLHTVLGPGIPGAFALFAALGAWAFAETAVARRLCAFSAALALLLWNPFAASFVAAHLTSAPTYWRVLWLLPVPALTAIVLTSPIERGLPPRWGAGIAVAAAVLLFGASVATTPRALAPSAANHVRIAAPGWKVPPSELDAARAIVAATTPRDTVLAARLVAPWIPTFPGYPTPLVVRSEYLPVLHAALGPEELARRMRLMRIVSGDRRVPRAADLLRSAIAEDSLAVVCLAKRASQSPAIPRLLAESGFQKIHANADYEVWKRSSTL